MFFRCITIVTAVTFKLEFVEKELLKRYFVSQVSKGETKQVEEWISDSGNKDNLLEYIENSYNLEKNEMPVGSFDEMFKKIRDKKPAPAKVVNIRQRWIWAVSAASIVFLLLGTLIGYQFNGNNMDENWEMSTAETAYGQYAQLTLSDGSEVYLAGDSKISFPKEMKANRVVYLEGEAYFNLQNENKNLTIKTKDIVTTAKNSKLNISAFSKDSVVTVTVEKGKAEVKNNNEVFPMMTIGKAKTDSTTELLPKSIPLVKLLPSLTVRQNQQATYDKETKLTDVSRADSMSLPFMKLIPLRPAPKKNENSN